MVAVLLLKICPSNLVWKFQPFSYNTCNSSNAQIQSIFIYIFLIAITLKSMVQFGCCYIHVESKNKKPMKNDLVNINCRTGNPQRESGDGQDGYTGTQKVKHDSRIQSCRRKREAFCLLKRKRGYLKQERKLSKSIMKDSMISVIVAVIGMLFMSSTAQADTSYFGGTNNQDYLDWLSTVSCNQSIFIASDSNPDNSVAVHWSIVRESRSIPLAIVAPAKGLHGQPLVWPNRGQCERRILSCTLQPPTRSPIPTYWINLSSQRPMLLHAIGNLSTPQILTRSSSLKHSVYWIQAKHMTSYH